MFDLKYYDTRRKLHNFFQEDKNKQMTRESTHNLFKDCKVYKSPKNSIKEKLKMMPESRLKNIVLELYEREGEKALVKSGLFKC